MKPIRSALFVPGNRPDRIAKALALDADCVIIDLEDAVPLAEKENARAIVRKILDENPGKYIFVRINALTTPYAGEDIACLGSKNLAGVMLPKAESPAELIELNRLLCALEKNTGLKKGSLGIISLCETAKGLENIYCIASVKTSPSRDIILAFGAADYCLDLGIVMSHRGTGINYPRERIPVACRAAGIAPPLDSPWMLDLKDIDGMYADARQAKSCGFQGKLCIHPNQIQPCHEVFTPTENEIIHARHIIRSFEEGERQKQAAIQVDGKFIDYPVVEQARRIVAIAESISNQPLFANGGD